MFNLLFIIDFTAVFLVVLMHVFFEPFQSLLNSSWKRWSVCSGGFAVGYVFFVLFPKLSLMGHNAILAMPERPMLMLTLIYGTVLFGFITYWIIDLLSLENQKRSQFWSNIKVASFVMYNVLIGELLVSSKVSHSVVQLIVTISIVFHLAGMNHLFYHWSPKFFKRTLRWLMPIGLIIGASFSHLELLSKPVVVFMTAFIGGAILINVFYYEMPKNRSEGMGAFISGITLFLVMIVSVRLIAFTAEHPEFDLLPTLPISNNSTN